MLQYWGDQLFYGIETGFANLEAKTMDYPNSLILKSYIEKKREELETFKSLTKRFCTLGTETEVVRQYLVKVKKNRLNPHHEDDTFLSILWQGSLYFEIPEKLLNMIKEEQKFSYSKQLSFDDILTKEDSSNDGEDPH